MKLKTQGLLTMEQIRAFLEGTHTLDFDLPTRDALYDWIASELRRFPYKRLGRGRQGLFRRYLEKVSGLSRAQMTRLIRQFRDTGSVGTGGGHRPDPSRAATPTPTSAS